METKYCNAGKHDVDKALMVKDAGSLDGLDRRCRACASDYQMRLRLKGPKGVKDKKKRLHPEVHIKKILKIRIATYSRMLEKLQKELAVLEAKND